MIAGIIIRVSKSILGSEDKPCLTTLTCKTHSSLKWCVHAIVSNNDEEWHHSVLCLVCPGLQSYFNHPGNCLLGVENFIYFFTKNNLDINCPGNAIPSDPRLLNPAEKYHNTSEHLYWSED